MKSRQTVEVLQSNSPNAADATACADRDRARAKTANLQVELNTTRVELNTAKADLDVNRLAAEQREGELATSQTRHKWLFFRQVQIISSRKLTVRFSQLFEALCAMSPGRVFELGNGDPTAEELAQLNLPPLNPSQVAYPNQG